LEVEVKSFKAFGMPDPAMRRLSNGHGADADTQKTLFPNRIDLLYCIEALNVFCRN
jgi:hypothetical protein